MTWVVIFKANQWGNLSSWPLIWRGSSGANLKHCHGEMMSSGGEVTDLIHADWKGSSESCLCMSLCVSVCLYK